MIAATMAAMHAMSTLPAISPADSARAVATVYTLSLLATVPIVIAIVAAWLLRRASAEGRTLVWRSAFATLLVLFVGRQLPLHWMAWVVPSALATPLIELGRVQVAPAMSRDAPATVSAVQLVLIAYLAGVALVLIQTMIATTRARWIVSGGDNLGGDWQKTLNTLQRARGVRRRVRLVSTPSVAVPMTLGWARPVIAVPTRALEWSAEQRRMVLLHELEHVRAGDWAFNVVGRVVCALFWFHPAAWWMASQLRRDCEIACDDRVIAAGIRRSDYAELLVSAADDLLWRGGALALAERGGLRTRLASVLDTRHDVLPLARRWVAAACMSTIAIAAPMSAVQLAPTRDVLTTLMRDTRWESRAYAVLGLAQRPDSIAVARDAAELDPNPRVRAWARYALRDRGGQSAGADAAALNTILHSY
jgi:beta-lactamase regulating signal transducer with metallopeptidase domain